MNECLITKLKSNVSDNELYHIGEIRAFVTMDGSDNEQLLVRGVNPQPGVPSMTIEARFDDGSLKKEISLPTVVKIKQTKGDVIKMYPCYNLSEIRLNNVHVDFEELKYCTNLRYIQGFTGEGVNDLSYLYGLEGFEAYKCSLKSGGAKVIGDLSKMPKSFLYMSATIGMQDLTWATNRPSDAKIISMNYINLGSYVDAMLINQAKCTAVDSTDLDFGFQKIISVYGTRTSASDEAVQILKEKGYTVNFNGAEL